MDEKRPGRRLLIAGAVAYGGVMLISLAFLAVGRADAGGALWTLIFMPPSLGLIAVAMSPAALVYALISGLPAVSLIYFFKTAKLYWRVPLGGLLLASAVIAGAYGFIHIR